jgi:hypothetical protein
MTKYLTPLFIDPASTARYLGETVGTHYSVALRATAAYATHLAAKRESLHTETFEGESLGNFWRDLLEMEQVEVGSPRVLKGLGRNPSHYFQDFLGTADAVFRSRYENVPVSQKGKSRKIEHSQCLRFLRNHNDGGIHDHFSVQNKVAAWIQLLKMIGKYQE